MPTTSLFIIGTSQAVRILKELEFEGISEVEVTRNGDSIVLTPRRKSWSSFSEIEKPDNDFMVERVDVIEDGRVVL